MSSDGKTNYLIFTGYGSDPVAGDAYQQLRGVFTFSTTHSEAEGLLTKKRQIDISINPNPFFSQTRIDIVFTDLGVADASIKIFDTQGKLVGDFSEELKWSPKSLGRSLFWDAKENTPGIYVVKVYKSSKTKIKKLVFLK